jgi:hypothetical protein
MRHCKYNSFLFTILTFFSLSAFAFAADEAQSKSSPTAGGAIIVGIVCYMARKRPIGGWLLYFYINLYLGLIVALALFVLLSFGNHLKSAWSSSGLYFLSIAFTLISQLLFVVQAIIATILLKTREWKWIKVLRAILVVDLCWSSISCIIDIVYFPNSLALNFMSLIWPLIWLPYFFRSERVRRVFLLKDWGVDINASSLEAFSLEATTPDGGTPVSVNSSENEIQPTFNDPEIQIEKIPETIQAKLRTVEDLWKQSLISREEYDTKRKQILSRI